MHADTKSAVSRSICFFTLGFVINLIPQILLAFLKDGRLNPGLDDRQMRFVEGEHGLAGMREAFSEFIGGHLKKQM